MCIRDRLDPADLPFGLAQLPGVFTQFRTRVENARVRPRQPLPVPSAVLSGTPPAVPPWPAALDGDTREFSYPELDSFLVPNLPLALKDKARAAMDIEIMGVSSFPYHMRAFQGGERAGLAHLRP